MDEYYEQDEDAILQWYSVPKCPLYICRLPNELFPLGSTVCLCYLFLSANQLTQIICIKRINTPRKQGGLGTMKIPLLSDLTHQIAKDYGVFLEDQGHTLRYDITKQSPGVGYPH